MSERTTSEEIRRPVEPLPPDRLYRECDPALLEFTTTEKLEEPEGIVGQPRASRAVLFGMGIRQDGFNLFALGSEEANKQALIRHFLQERASREPPPGDLCYVNDFKESHRARALRLPPGVGRGLSEDVDRFLEELQATLRAAFESEEYQGRRQAVQEEAGEEQEQAFEHLRERARERDLALLRTPAGFVFAPVRDGEVVPPEEFEKLGEEERSAVKEKIEELQEELQRILRGVPRQQREIRERVRKLNREMARLIIQELLESLRERYGEHPEVVAHLDAVEKDVVENVRSIVTGDDGSSTRGPSPDGASPPGGPPQIRRYRVNVLVDHRDAEHAPVVYEDHPTYQNLVGRIEYLPVMGTLLTDFNLIRPGALHRAHGGYLILDARRVLTQPFAWDGLKRVLQTGTIRIESPREALGLMSTISLDPEPMPLDVKVVLLGERLLYYLLCQQDPDFPELFKVAADFADEMDRTPEAEATYARLIAGLARQDDLRPFDREAVARVIERAARLAGDAEKLSVHTRSVQDLLREANHWAEEEGAEVVGRSHVQRAIDEWIYRSDRIRERTQEAILRDTIYIDTDGRRTGQVNGLSVLQLGSFAFGRPNRITARVRLGTGEVVNIEREVELSGPIHSKGVLILAGFLGGRYAGGIPLSLSASLVFEQSYSGVEGDSASSAELYALLSAIADVPLRQSVAITGSVNQHGQIQPIGGVNEKVEGFFDVCRARGLTGDQGVLIPRSNVKHLMLRDDVREACAEGRFHIWAVETVDQGMELLADLPMGQRDPETGDYPEGTLNSRIARRLAELSAKRKEFHLPSVTAGDPESP